MTNAQKIFDEYLSKLQIGLILKTIEFDEWEQYYNIYMTAKKTNLINLESLNAFAIALIDYPPQLKTVDEEILHLRYKRELAQNLNVGKRASR